MHHAKNFKHLSEHDAICNILTLTFSAVSDLRAIEILFLSASFFFHDAPNEDAYFDFFGFSFSLAAVSFEDVNMPPVSLPKNEEGSNSRDSAST